MKKSIIYLTISATLTFSGCDYLDDMPYDWAQPDDIFTNEQNYLKPINQVYAYIPEGFNHVGNAFLDAATNDGISTIIDSDIHKLSRGYVTSSNPIEECWNKSYKGIQQAIFARKYLREADLVLQNKTEEDIQPDNVYQMHGSQISVKTLDLNLPFIEIAAQMDKLVESHFTGVIKAD